MPVAHYSYGLKRVIPMLTEDEFRPIARLLRSRPCDIQQYMRDHPSASLTEAKHGSASEALDCYERATGVRLESPDMLHWVELARYGLPCPSCGKLMRTPFARLCAACGFELPEGEVAGPAT
jgi:hypothetical protein